MKAKIYQIRDFEHCNYVFRSWEKASKECKLNDYKLVYEMELGDCSHLTSWEVLDDMFYIFNQDRPMDFKGHSLSVSDVVMLEDEKEYEKNGFYYCDSFGWQKIF